MTMQMITERLTFNRVPIRNKIIHTKYYYNIFLSKKKSRDRGKPTAASLDRNLGGVEWKIIFIYALFFIRNITTVFIRVYVV